MEMLDACHELDAWFVTRIHLDEWIVTHMRGDTLFERGDALPVSPAVRERILRGRRMKSSIEKDLVAIAESRGVHDIEAAGHGYIGAPLVVNDQLYGAICGVSIGAPLTDSQRESPLLMTASRVLSTILRKELDADELVRRAERAEAEALVDELTGLFNRRGWDRLIEREETRAARYDHAATVFMMDVDGLKRTNDELGHNAGDLLLRRAADAIRSVIREHDIAARLGGDEFAVLAVESDADDAVGLHERLEAAFAEAGVSLSVGMAYRERSGGILAAIDRADTLMYARKAERRAKTPR
jgi:diguanylate cyclase (GGDEF)-like protein